MKKTVRKRKKVFASSLPPLSAYIDIFCLITGPSREGATKGAYFHDAHVKTIACFG